MQRSHRDQVVMDFLPYIYVYIYIYIYIQRERESVYTTKQYIIDPGRRGCAPIYVHVYIYIYIYIHTYIRSKLLFANCCCKMQQVVVVSCMFVTRPQCCLHVLPAAPKPNPVQKGIPLYMGILYKREIVYKGISTIKRNPSPGEIHCKGKALIKGTL